MLLLFHMNVFKTLTVEIVLVVYGEFQGQLYNKHHWSSYLNTDES